MEPSSTNNIATRELGITGCKFENCNCSKRKYVNEFMSVFFCDPLDTYVNFLVYIISTTHLIF
jgi:hypothetical protein